MARRKVGSKSKARPDWTVTEVVELATRHNLAELEVESGGTRVRVVREHAPGGAAPRTEMAAERVPQIAPADEAAAAANLLTIDAPMVGTFYRAAAPEAGPFVAEGDVINEGQVLCIIEAMKLMNEIEAKMAGRIVKVLVENGQPVEYGQPLFLVEPRR
ncbi:MAG TPA: acetyl-CoA carboxylase biotin carboxyl carrier protein [Methylomirabilota bacterium]|jgi:acetyl-CoA carboxylase biotin carboxyl carrier protein|nr:acetyl-CoA carboxylase biotin carboxyl carrier protein [Methylomirabilota bacterium]